MMGEIVRLGRPHDGGYSVSTLAIDASKGLLGYGIQDDNSFEMAYSDRTGNPSHGYDCGESYPPSHRLYKHYSECIGSLETVCDDRKKSNAKLTHLKQHLRRIPNPVFLKMDIEGGETLGYQDIITYSDNITGVAIELHNLDNQSNQDIIKALDEKFYLVNIHFNNHGDCRKILIEGFDRPVTSVVELSYINKKLAASAKKVKSFKIPFPHDQKCILAYPEVFSTYTS